MGGPQKVKRYQYDLLALTIAERIIRFSLV
jgi:hypothetical protein